VFHPGDLDLARSNIEVLAAKGKAERGDKQGVVER
jgi:hypothetical protein